MGREMRFVFVRGAFRSKGSLFVVVRFDEVRRGAAEWVLQNLASNFRTDQNSREGRLGPTSPPACILLSRAMSRRRSA